MDTNLFGDTERETAVPDVIGAVSSSDDLSEAFKAFTCKKRLSILSVLAAGDRNVTEICDALSLSQPAVSQQLGVLREHGLVIGERQGKAVLYRLNRPRIAGFYAAFGSAIGCGGHPAA